MKKYYAAMMLMAYAMGASTGDYTKYVDPFIGTGAIDGGLSGNNYPGCGLFPVS